MTPREEIEFLLLDWEDGCLDDVGLDRIRELVRSDEDARLAYVQHQMLNVALQPDMAATDASTASQPLLTSTLEPQQTNDSSGHKQQLGSGIHNFNRQIISWVLAAAVLIAVTARLAYHEFLTDEPAVAVTDGSDEDNAIETRPEDTAFGVASVNHVVDGTLQSADKELQPGDAVPPGPLMLTSGIAQIEFFCGATLIVEGPADLNVKSALLAEVREGRLRAQVPPAARGFSLIVNDLKVVDLGTEFALAVNDRQTDVQVFDGEVELHSDQHDLQKLTAGQGVSIDAAGDSVATQPVPEQFADIQQVEDRVQRQNQASFNRWQSWSESIRQDSRLVVYYTFQNSDTFERILPDRKSAADGELNGAIVGAQQADGRWPLKSALDFKRPGDRVRLQVPGEFNSLTFAAWVQIDSLDKQFNSLFLTDNYNRGEPHWQILGDGRMYFSVRPAERGSGGPGDYKVLSDPIWQPSMSGQWILLATTFEAETGRVVHYLNGRAIHDETIPVEQRVEATQIGTASLGNWSLPTLPNAEFAIRNLNGSMDEFLLFADALAESEIEDIYKHGRP